jgi:hypothetical protein
MDHGWDGHDVAEGDTGWDVATWDHHGHDGADTTSVDHFDRQDGSDDHGSHSGHDDRHDPDDGCDDDGSTAHHAHGDHGHDGHRHDGHGHGCDGGCGGGCGHHAQAHPDDDCDSLSAVTTSHDGSSAAGGGSAGDAGADGDAGSDPAQQGRPLVPGLGPAPDVPVPGLGGVPLTTTGAAGLVPPVTAGFSYRSLPGIDGVTGGLLDRAAAVGQEAIDHVNSTFGPGSFEAARQQAVRDGVVDQIAAARGIEDPAERFFRVERENIARHGESEANQVLGGLDSGSLSNGL